jgi:hypothetical protein
MNQSVNTLVSPPSVTRGRLILVGIIGLFAIPVIIAQAILSFQWYQAGVTNKGDLIEPYYSFEQLPIDNPHVASWQLVYVVPDQCDSNCKEQISMLYQSYVSLGKYQGRVVPMVFQTRDSDQSVLELENIGISQILMDSRDMPVSTGDFIIIDPLGQWVMKFSNMDQDDPSQQHFKYLLSDFKKMLKLSRVG